MSLAVFCWHLATVRLLILNTLCRETVHATTVCKLNLKLCDDGVGDRFQSPKRRVFLKKPERWTMSNNPITLTTAVRFTRSYTQK
jgi:hypothetical protein